MANQALELHDSTLAVLWYGQDGEAVLIFSSLYIHESEGQPGVDSGRGWFQRAELVIENASLTEDIRAWPCEIFDGEIVIDEVRYRNGAPLPLRCKERFKISVNAIDDDSRPRQIEIVGSGVTLTLLGKATGMEEFPGAG
jgi:hypothetical protein